MYADDHNPPHIHLWHVEGEARIDLNTLAIIRGNAPKRELQKRSIG